MGASPKVDPAFLKALQSGDSNAFANVIRENTETLLCAAYGLGFQGTDAEDLVQDTFSVFVKNAHNFEGRSSVRTYLFGILHNKARELRRETSRELTTDPIDAVFEDRFGIGGIWRTIPRGPEEEAVSQETARLLEECSQKLPVQQRMAFYLKEAENESTESICNILGISPTHLGVLLFRVRNKLRECIQQKWRGQP